MVTSKYSLCDIENSTCEFKLCSMLNERPMEKTWFMAPTEYNPNGKGIAVPKEYVLMVHNPNGKGMVLRKIV